MPYTDKDRYIRANIRSLVNSIKAAPEATPKILDLASQVSSMSSVFDVSKYLGVAGATGSSVWNLGTNTTSLLKSAAYLAPTLANKNGISILFRNGLLEELVSIEPHTAENILQNIVIHPFIKAQREASGMGYLSDQETVECIQLILKFAHDLPPKAVAELGNSLADLMEPKEKIAEQEVAKSNEPSPYLPIIQTLVNKEFLAAALVQPKIIEKEILPSLTQYLVKLDNEKLKQIVGAATELASQPEVKKVLSPKVNHQLISNIFNLPQLKESPYRKLAYDLAKSKPNEFEKLINTILSSSAKKDLKPITAKILDFVDLPKEESPENDAVFDDLVLSLVKLIATPNIRKEVGPLLNTELLDNVFDLPQLKDSPYRTLTHNLAARQPEHFQKLADGILASPFEKELKPVFSKILAFLHLPKEDSPGYNQDYNDKIFDDLVLSLIDLVSKPKLRDKLKPILTVGLIDDIFDLPQLKESPYRKLVHDLAQNQPEELQELLHGLLGSSFATDLKPFMSSVLEFTRLPDDKSPKYNQAYNDKVFGELIDSLLSMAAKPPIPAKLAPLLTPKIIDNVFALPQLKKMGAYKLIAKKTATNLANHPKNIETILKTYNDFKHSSNDPVELRNKKIIALVDASVATLQHQDVMTALTNTDALTSIAAMLEINAPRVKSNKFTENIRRDMPIVLEETKDEIIAACGEMAYNAYKASADEAAKISAKTSSSEVVTPTSQVATVKPGLSIKDYFDIVAGAPPATHKNIINIITQNKKEIANSVDLISAKAPSDPVVKLLRNFGIQGDDITYFAEKVCNPSGLKAIGRYVDNPSTINLARIFIETNTLPFGIKHLMISYKNYFQGVETPAPAPIVSSSSKASDNSRKRPSSLKKGTWEERIDQEKLEKRIRSASTDSQKSQQSI